MRESELVAMLERVSPPSAFAEAFAKSIGREAFVAEKNYIYTSYDKGNSYRMIRTLKIEAKEIRADTKNYLEVKQIVEETTDGGISLGDPESN